MKNVYGFLDKSDETGLVQGQRFVVIKIEDAKRFALFAWH
jgi:hypothetical protein